MICCCLSDTTIGIIIGSVFTLLGVIANGVITYFLNRSSHNAEVEENKRCEQEKATEEKITKREKAYRDFANYYGVMNLLLGFAYATRNSQINGTVLGGIFAEKFKDNLSRSAEVISDVSLYGSAEIGNMSVKYSAMWNGISQKQSLISTEDLTNLDQELMIVVVAMKKELGFDKL